MLALAVPQVNASIFDFSYSFTDAGSASHTISGEMVGTLQGDNNTVDVSAIQNLIFDSLAQPSMSFTSSADVFFGDGSLIPAVTLDGSFMDFYACHTLGGSSGCDLYVVINNGNGIATTQGFSDFTYQSGADFSNNTFYGSPFVSANWTMSETSPVPVPATLPLLAISAGAFVWQRRRQSR
ncbi:hypothetical protein CEK71_03480 [Methylovulum psychrotolerans]|nr:hypothetical protein CEK71_03480 [Methylovulum psychrotolerans]